MNKDIAQWIDEVIVPRYDAFDKGHRRDLGLSVDRKTHHLESGRIIRGIRELRAIINSPAELRRIFESIFAAETSRE